MQITVEIAAEMREETNKKILGFMVVIFVKNQWWAKKTEKQNSSLHDSTKTGKLVKSVV